MTTTIDEAAALLASDPEAVVRALKATIRDRAVQDFTLRIDHLERELAIADKVICGNEENGIDAHARTTDARDKVLLELERTREELKAARTARDGWKKRCEDAEKLIEQLREEARARPPSFAGGLAHLASVTPAASAQTASSSSAVEASPSAAAATERYVITRRDKFGRRFLDEDHEWMDHVDTLHGTRVFASVEHAEAEKPRGSRVVAMREVAALVALDAARDAEKQGASDEAEAERDIEQLGARGADLEDQIDAAMGWMPKPDIEPSEGETR